MAFPLVSKEKFHENLVLGVGGKKKKEKEKEKEREREEGEAFG